MGLSYRPSGTNHARAGFQAEPQNPLAGAPTGIALGAARHAADSREWVEEAVRRAHMVGGHPREHLLAHRCSPSGPVRPGRTGPGSPHRREVNAAPHRPLRSSLHPTGIAYSCETPATAMPGACLPLHSLRFSILAASYDAPPRAGGLSNGWTKIAATPYQLSPSRRRSFCFLFSVPPAVSLPAQREIGEKTQTIQPVQLGTVLPASIEYIQKLKITLKLTARSIFFLARGHAIWTRV